VPTASKKRLTKLPARFIEPMLSLAVAELPEGPNWTYELKFDGYRALGLKTNGRVQLLFRKGKDFTERFASIARALGRSLTRPWSTERSSPTTPKVAPHSTSCNTT
jgi:ATP-dependent DNA ligase